MRRQLAPVLAAAALLLGACAAVPKYPALPPPLESAPSTAQPGQPAPATWYQPLQTDALSKWDRAGLGVLFATQYGFTDEVTKVKTDVDMVTGPEIQVRPLEASLPAVYFTKGPGFYGFTYGKMEFGFDGFPPIKTNVLGLYEGVRVPITLADFKGPDIQLFLIPGLTLQVLYMSGKSDLDPSAGGFKMDYGLLAGGSLNGAGIGIAVGDWLVLEADFWKWGWTYVDFSMKRPDGKDQTGSFSAFSSGKSPVLFARVMF